MMLNWSKVLLLIVPFISVAFAASSTLRHVNLLYRHGDRSPIMVYPLDKNKESVWKDGLGWLTDIGKLEKYELGQWVRARYGGFLNVTRYDNRQIAVQSSALPRCLMSAYSHLAGLFPPQDDQIFKTGLNWQPIPVSIVPLKEDNKLAMQAACPRYDQLYQQKMASKDVQAYANKNADFFKEIANATGMKADLPDMMKVTDTLFCEKAHNLTWNNWAYDVGKYERLHNTTIYGWDLLYATTEMAKLKGGPLLKEMIGNMNTAAKDKTSLLKVHMYSGHGTTVSALLQVMHVFNYSQPEPVYRTLVMVELHEINNDHVVKIFLHNDTTVDPYYLVPPGCEDPCKLSTFQTVLKDSVPKDWNAECKAINSATQSGLSPGGVLFVLIIAFNSLMRH